MDEEFAAVRFKKGYGFYTCMLATFVEHQDRHWVYVPWFSSNSVIVCHLFVATNHLSSFLRHERSMTSLVLSLPMAWRTACRRSMEKVDEGKRYDVMITYCALISPVSCS